MLTRLVVPFYLSEKRNFLSQLPCNDAAWSERPIVRPVLVQVGGKKKMQSPETLLKYALWRHFLAPLRFLSFSGNGASAHPIDGGVDAMTRSITGIWTWSPPI